MHLFFYSNSYDPANCYVAIHKVLVVSNLLEGGLPNIISKSTYKIFTQTYRVHLEKSTLSACKSPAVLRLIYWREMPSYFMEAFVFTRHHLFSAATLDWSVTSAGLLPLHWFLFLFLFSSPSFSHSHACLSSREWFHIFARWVFHALICMVLMYPVETSNLWTTFPWSYNCYESCQINPIKSVNAVLQHLKKDIELTILLYESSNV